MVNTAEFARLHKELAAFDDQRDVLIKKSRDVVSLSKQIIYAVHRNEVRSAEKLVKDIKASVRNLVSLTKKHPALYYTGALRIAEQEFVEAVAYYSFIAHHALPTAVDLGVDTENYLLGICDLFGELMRRATNSAIKENYQEVVAIRNFLSDLYDELMKFEFRNSELRKKFDGLKYELKKVEHLILELKLKEKI